MPHASEKNKHRRSDDVDRFCNHWQISTVVEKSFHIFQWLLSWLLHREKDYLLPTWAQKITLSDVSTESSRWNVSKLFSELKLVTDNISLYLKPFMRGQRLTGTHEPAKCHNANQQSIQDFTFMQKVVSCMTTLWPKTNTLVDDFKFVTQCKFTKNWNGW